jgi:serine/threonine protein kinase
LFDVDLVIHTCPSDTVLRQFNEGRIDDLAVIDQITDHLGLCDACIDKLESMAPGPIAEGLRQSASKQLIASDTNSLEEDLDLESIRGSVDHVISKSDSLFSDQPANSAEFAENRYQVIGSIGKDDFGCVFGASAEDSESSPVSAELFAIKIPHAHKLTSYGHSQQFFEDCEKAKGLEHPGIRSVLEFGHWDDKQLFYSMPLLQHPTMTKFVKGSTNLHHSSMLSMFKQLVDAVNYAHQQNVVHRHLDPGNIHVILPDLNQFSYEENSGRGLRVVVSDFGFVLDSRYHFDLIEPINSNNPFVSPESATLNAEFIDERADIYSLGKILKLLSRIIVDPHDEDRINRIIDKSTFVRRRDRYQTVRELKSALELI